jgi:glycosyltransferase involved in cell wall biosynthesis
MPAFNAEKYISQSIESVISQRYKNWELIIINDGSTDKTQILIEKYLKIDNRIRTYYQINGKQGKARNLGISHAKGNYIAFLDADDIWITNKLQTQVNEIIKYQVDLVFSKAYTFFNNNIENTDIMCGHLGIFNGESAIEKQIIQNRIPILTVLVKKEALMAVGGFNESILVSNAEDYHLWLKLLFSNYKFFGSDKILAYYRILFTSSTGDDKNALNKLPFVYHDLIELYPKFKNILVPRLKQSLIVYNKIHGRNKNEILASININCMLLNRNNIKLTLKIITLILPIKFSVFIVNKLLNV